MKNKIIRTGFLFGLILMATNSVAGLMTFNGTVSDGDFQYLALSYSYSEDGYTMINNSGDNFFLDNDFDPDINHWDDDVLEFNSRVESKVTFTSNTGMPFDFISGYFGSSFGETSELTFEGVFVNGGSILHTQSYTVGSRDFYSFIGFSNLSSLVISAPTDGYFPVMDDIRFEASTTTTATVPEPSTLAILALGLMGLASSRFKKG